MTSSPSGGGGIRGKSALGSALWLRVGILLVLVSALVLVLISFLNYSNYRKTYSELSLMRHLVLTKDLRQTVVAGLNIGLSSAENARLSHSLAELVRRHEDVRYLLVLEDGAGIVSEGHPPAAMEPVWRTRLGSVNVDSYWQTVNEDTIELGLPFVNNFNVKSGAVVIGYERAPIEHASSVMLRKLVIDVAGTLTALAVLVLGCVYLLTRRFAHGLAEIDASLDGVLTAPEAPRIQSDMLEPGMANDVNNFAAMTHHLVREMAQLEQDIALSSTGSRS